MRLAPVPIAYHLCPLQALDVRAIRGHNISSTLPIPPNFRSVGGWCFKVAAWQSLATHPGPEALPIVVNGALLYFHDKQMNSQAALCCRFMASFCVEAISRHRTSGYDWAHGEHCVGNTRAETGRTHPDLTCRNAGKTSDAELLGLTFMDDPTFPSFRF